MIGRLWTRLFALAAALAIALPAQPAPLHRIVAVGDLHGDFAAWRAIARAAGLVDAQGRWSGGRTVLVQAGDAVDRGPDSLKIVQDLMRLQREAQRAGGQVVALVGNHEAMNMTDDLRYVSAGDYAAFADARSAERRDQVYEANKAALEAAYRAKRPEMTPDEVKQAWLAATPLGLVEHQAAWHAEGRIGRWVIGNPALVLLDGTLFVHGGLCPPYDGVPIAELNRQIAAALKAQAKAPEAIINDPAGPLWCRRLAAGDAAAAAAEPGPSVHELVDQALAATGARRIVIAHTPILSGIAVLDAGRLVRIDTGISAVFGGTPSYLEILDGELVPHAVARPAAGRP